MTDHNEITIDLSEIVTLLNKDNNLNILERIVEIYLAGNPTYSASEYVSFQISLYDILGDKTGIIIHLLKMHEDLPYHGSNREIYRRFINLKKVAGNHFRTIDQVLTSPDKLKGNLFSYNDSRPYEILGTFIKNNGEDFSFSIDFNDGMNLSKSLIENLYQKLKQGANNIDRGTYYMLKEQFNDFSSNIEAIIKSEDENSGSENQE